MGMGIKILIHGNGNGNRTVGMAGNGNTDCVPAHLFCEVVTVFSECELTSSPVRLSVTFVHCARAPYSGDWNFRQCFYAIWYVGHPLTEIIPGEPLRRGGG